MFFHFSKKPYIVVLGMIQKPSGAAIDTQQVREAISYVNAAYQEDIAAKFLMTSGHEIQGLFHSGEHLMGALGDLRQRLYPIPVQFGIGIGDLTMDFPSDVFLGADGPAYDLARSALTEVMALENKNRKALSYVKTKIEGEHDLQALSLNTIFLFISHIERKWTPTQRHVISYMMSQKKNQTETALQFGVSQSNIQQILSKGNYYAYQEAMNSSCCILREIKQES